jgi:hypothetical protein
MVITYLVQTILSLQQLWYCFLNCVYSNPRHVNFSCGKKPEHPEKIHDFRQSVDWFFTWVGSENPTHELRGEMKVGSSSILRKQKYRREIIQ